MKLEFDFDMEDWLAFQKYHLVRSKGYRIRSYTRTLLMPLLIAGILMYKYSKDIINWQTVLITLSIVFIGLFLFQNWSLKKYLKKISNEIPEDQKVNILGKHQLDFGKNVIKFSIPGKNYTIQWPSVEHIIILKDNYFLYKSAEMVIIIPKKKLNISVNDMNKLDQFIESKKELLSR